jgi:hypothetical protein
MKSVIDTAERFAQSRIWLLSDGNTRFKINAKELKTEMVTAAMFGELSAMERIIAEMVSDKSLTREDIEAKLHLAIVELYNAVGPRLHNKGLPVNLESYLNLRGYYGKTAGSETVSTQ